MRTGKRAKAFIAGAFVLALSFTCSDVLAQSIHYPRNVGHSRNVGHHYRNAGRRNIGNYSFYAAIGPGCFNPCFGYGGFPIWGVYPGYFGAYGVQYNSATNDANYWLPPVYAPAELMYGPKANARFFGVENPVANPPRDIALPTSFDLRRSVSAAEVAAKLRKSNDAARERGQKFIEYGDALFREQRFHEALQRYKSAAEAAPDLSNVYFRQGHALIAVNQLALAAKAFKIAANLDPVTARRGFDVNTLYADGGIVKTTHLEILAGQVLEDSRNADLLFLVGVFLHNDGQHERAQRFFAKSFELAEDDTAHLRPYLDEGAAAKKKEIPALIARDT
jgi:tetratricopeptide (TPR) repeat protein